MCVWGVVRRIKDNGSCGKKGRVGFFKDSQSLRGRRHFGKDGVWVVGYLYWRIKREDILVPWFIYGNDIVKNLLKSNDTKSRVGYWYRSTFLVQNKKNKEINDIVLSVHEPFINNPLFFVNFPGSSLTVFVLVLWSIWTSRNVRSFNFHDRNTYGFRNWLMWSVNRKTKGRCLYEGRNVRIHRIEEFTHSWKSDVENYNSCNIIDHTKEHGIIPELFIVYR